MHGWVYGLHDGLLKDLDITMDRPDDRGRRSSRAALKRYPRAATPRPRAALTSDRPARCSRTASPTAAPSTSRRRCSTASTATTACSARPARAAKRRFERADWHGQQRAQRERIEFYDQRVRRGGASGCSSEFEAADAVDGHLAAGQAALHRPADRPPPARAGRDLLQLGHDQDPAPQLLPQRLHLRAAGGQHRVHRERRARRRCPPTAPTTRRATRCARRWLRIVAQLPAAAASSRTSSRDIDDVLRRAARRSSARLPAARQLPDPGAVQSLFFRNKGAYLVGKIINGFNETPFALPILHDADGAAGHRHRAVRRGRPADAVQLRARLLHGRHGGARRPTCSSCAR